MSLKVFEWTCNLVDTVGALATIRNSEDFFYIKDMHSPPALDKNILGPMTDSVRFPFPYLQNSAIIRWR